MRTWTPALGLAALATTGLLLTGHPTPAQSQVVPVAGGVATADVEFRSGSIEFGATRGEEAVKPVTVSFQGRQVLSAETLLKGFDVAFVDAEHPVHQTKVTLEDVQISGESVKFNARLFIRDNSGKLDDSYSGHIDYVVMARTR